MTIKEEIQNKKDELTYLKDQYAELIESIKEACYRVSLFSEDNKHKPDSDEDIMKAAYHYSRKECVRMFNTVNINRGRKHLKSRGNDFVYEDYWTVYIEKSFNSYPIYILRKKNIKVLGDICKDLWKIAINNKYGETKTELGFKEWLDTTDVDDIIELMKNEECNLDFDLVTERKLYLKDIIIIYPYKRTRFE